MFITLNIITLITNYHSKHGVNNNHVILDTKDELDQWERVWSTTSRSKMIDQKRDRGETSGFLDQQVHCVIICITMQQLVRTMIFMCMFYASTLNKNGDGAIEIPLPYVFPASLSKLSNDHNLFTETS